MIINWIGRRADKAELIKPLSSYSYLDDALVMGCEYENKMHIHAL